MGADDTDPGEEPEKTDRPRMSLASLIHSKVENKAKTEGEKLENVPSALLETESVSETENIGGDSTPNLKDEREEYTENKPVNHDMNIVMEALQKGEQLAGEQLRRGEGDRNRRSEGNRRSESG